MINYQVKKCCEDMPHHMYVLKTDSRIDIEADHYFDFQDVKYCMYCGNRLRLEPKPETPKAEPETPDLSSLSPKDKALEELKTEMDTKAVKDYIKAKDLLIRQPTKLTGLYGNITEEEAIRGIAELTKTKQ